MKTKVEEKPASSKIIIDNSLKKYEGKTLFPEKLAKANEMLRTIGIPEDFRHKGTEKTCK